MSDQELLMLAAKAVGLRFAINGDDLPGYIAVNSGDWRNGWTFWNPLASDGDALRLAVKLGLSIGPHPKLPIVECSKFPTKAREVVDFNEVCGSDAYAAWRRAIVRVAAAIGESMPTRRA